MWFRNKQLDRIEHGLNVVLDVLTIILTKENLIMATLQDLQAAVAAEQGVVQSAITLLGGLHDQLVAALAQNDPAAIQAVVDSINTQKQSLADAVAANPAPGA